MTEDPKREAHLRLVSRLLEGPGHSSKRDRRDAFNNTWATGPLRTLLEKVANQPARIVDEDLRRVEVDGITEDEIFELVVCTAVGAATRQYEAGLAALAAAIGDSGDSHDAP